MRKDLIINAQWLTSAEGLWECDVQDAAREVKVKKKAEVVAQKVSNQAVRIIWQAAQGSDVHFSGALSTKGKEDLINIENQLKIETMGTKLALLKAIRAHFDAHTELKYSRAVPNSRAFLTTIHMARSGHLSMSTTTQKIICHPQIINTPPHQHHSMSYHHPHS
ncbi:hypothetical protein PAXRUDRAFT_158814 [Paxillus rubicundulus Ve08.2h10]|uniref:SAP domain-containing protein n=1 Tax=Paxillus rubicundulus Ve08.2h10 TaxID=930991 RepID=A0A0D0CC71_9AGAM|nr:hypothetical protein PAXRUDRAFT_158814 [Paxillus rubicundulus Ve08.2h10]